MRSFTLCQTKRIFFDHIISLPLAPCSLSVFRPSIDSLPNILLLLLFDRCLGKWLVDDNKQLAVWRLSAKHNAFSVSEGAAHSREVILYTFLLLADGCFASVSLYFSSCLFRFHCYCLHARSDAWTPTPRRPHRLRSHSRVLPGRGRVPLSSPPPACLPCLSDCLFRRFGESDGRGSHSRTDTALLTCHFIPVVFHFMAPTHRAPPVFQCCERLGNFSLYFRAASYEGIFFLCPGVNSHDSLFFPCRLDRVAALHHVCLFSAFGKLFLRGLWGKTPVRSVARASYSRTLRAALQAPS